MKRFIAIILLLVAGTGVLAANAPTSSVRHADSGIYIPPK